jgi:hypothetical protein
VLSETGTVLADRPAEEDIDRAVAEFRGHLDRLDPDALSAALEGPPEGPGIKPAGTEPNDHDSGGV